MDPPSTVKVQKGAGTCTIGGFYRAKVDAARAMVDAIIAQHGVGAKAKAKAM